MEYKKIGKFILAKIRECGTVGEFEKRAGYSHQTVWLWTSGRKMPDMEQAIKIEHILKLRPKELVNRIEDIMYGKVLNYYEEEK